MDAEKIIQDLNRKFAAPLPEFYKRRIVVWIDEDGEFTDKLGDISLTNVKIVRLTGSNNFEVKKLLAVDDPDSNFLIYRPFPYESDDDNWLLDVELYSEEFRADLISMWMDEMGFPQTPSLRPVFKTYQKFFNAQSRRSKVSSQNSVPATSNQLKMAIMAALAGLKDAKPNSIVKAVLKAGLQLDSNAVYQDFVNYGVDETFWLMASQVYGFDAKNANSDLTPQTSYLRPHTSYLTYTSTLFPSEHIPDTSTLLPLAIHLLLSASSRTMRPECLAGFQRLISSANPNFCYEFVSEWIHSEDAKELYEIARAVENKLNLPQQYQKLSITDLIETEVFPCINEVILDKLMNDIGDNVIYADEIAQIVEKRRTCAWYDSVKNYYEGVLLVAQMHAFLKEHSTGFHIVEPAKVWQEYTSEYYKMDAWYRQFHKCFSEIPKDYNAVLPDLFIRVQEIVEGLYVNAFLGQLGENWSTACADNLRDYGRILEIPQQTEFYQNEVANSDSKVYVIISDAMRYEVAASLARQLQQETQANVNLKSMQGVFPTVTKFGMAALLPHKTLSVELKAGSLSVLADGQSTDAPNREKVLKTANPASVALKYKDVIGKKRAERREFVKGMSVVYIYHNTIDDAGHQESFDFTACDAAIDEIKNMVRIIVNEWGGTNIVITSDHGFLYTYNPLNEDDKVDKTTASDLDVEIGRRYAIMKKGSQPQYLLPVKFLGGDTPYDAFAPRENCRIKMKGGGMNFVHGGVSLQEMVVPVIEYHFLRNQNKEYLKNKNKYDTKPVEICLLSANRKICNMIFALDFYQKDAVGGNRESATYQLFFTDGAGKQISDVQKIIADKTSDNGQDRTFRCSFNLKSQKFSNTETYYLIFADEYGLPIQREEFQIDIPFAVDDFNFF